MSTTQAQLDRFELGVNCLLHFSLIFLCLTVLFVFIISRISSKTIQHEINTCVQTNLGNALLVSNAASAGTLKLKLQPYDPILSIMDKATKRPDQVTKVYNDGLFRDAYWMCGLFFTVIAVILLTLLAFKVKIGPMVGRLMLMNFFILLVVGLYEYFFFTTVCVKFVPIQPSTIMNSVLSSIKTSI